MKPELYRAINNRDGAAMASMSGGNPEHGRVVNSDAERLVDALFMQLKQISRQRRKPTSAPMLTSEWLSSNG